MKWTWGRTGGASLLSRHAGRPHIASVLVQDHRNDFSAPVALEVESRVDNLVKELVLSAREDREGGLPRELCFEMVALERDIECAEIEPVFADVVADRGGVERDFLRLGAEARTRSVSGPDGRRSDAGQGQLRRH